MIKNLKLFIVLAIVLSSIVLSSSYAQNPPPAPPDPEKMIQQMKKDLGLTDDQATKMKAAMQERQKAMEAAKNQPEESRRASAEKADKAFQDKAKTILTAEQFAKFKKKEEEHKANRRPRN